MEPHFFQRLILNGGEERAMHAPAHSTLQVRFGDFALDLTSGDLRKDGQKLALPPKAFEVLKALVERPGEVVTREELRARLWAADTFVEFDDSLNHAVNKLRLALGDSAENPQFIQTLPRFGYRFIAPELRAAEPEPAIRFLAVLPFANLSADPHQDYFADGMTDALITDLSKIGAVKVISRTSVMQFKGVKKPLPEIACELGVDGVIEGAVQRSDGRVRITVQLIRAATDTHLWAESYERDFRDVLSLQGEVARAVAREIKVALTPEESAHLASVRPVNPEAFEAYLKGQFHWYRLSPEHLNAALEYFELALKKDPAYALAYVGVANVWMMRGDTGSMAPGEAFPKAKEAISRALELDDSIAEAHITRANIVSLYDHDWSTAEQEFRSGTELNSNSADGHFMYADFLIWMKRWEEWNAEIQRVLELDPVNPFFRCFYGWHLVYQHRCDEAIRQLHKALAIEPDFSSAHMGLWGAFYKKGLWEEALAEARKFFSVLGDRKVEKALTRGYAEGGYARAMHLGAEELAKRAKRSHVPGVRIARLYAHAGENDQVMKWLQTACEQRETTLVHLGVGWDWDTLRADSRFQDLLRRVGLTS
ncbi:MAG: winged helix-turn-helix domain-containing protein [Candidatus Korobacteraceae bacterium]|jgi:TolB-like protein/Tfp pilus assembly protein PilF